MHLVTQHEAGDEDVRHLVREARAGGGVRQTPSAAALETQGSSAARSPA